jgi:hypothetical protein
MSLIDFAGASGAADSSSGAWTGRGTPGLRDARPRGPPHPESTAPSEESPHRRRRADILRYTNLQVAGRGLDRAHQRGGNRGRALGATDPGAREVPVGVAPTTAVR